MPYSNPRSAIVTGASRGIGAHMTRALAGAGWRVAALSRSGGLPELEDDWEVFSLRCDVTDAGQVEGAVDRAIGLYGSIQLLVNNAGLVEPELSLWESDVDTWWQVLVTNVKGPYLMVRAVVPHMISNGGGRIVNLNSGAATRERPDLTAYCASKSALTRITGGVALDGAGYGVHAFDLAPGVVATEMSTGMDLHRDRTEWTDPSEVTDLLLAIAGGELDAYSGRMVRAGADPIDVLKGRAEQGLADGAGMLRLRSWDPDDPVG